MPLVTRKITLENDNTCMSKDTFDHVLYVAPGKMKEGDVVTEPVSNDQLAELAAQYPDEYAQQAKDLGISPAEAGQLARLLAMPAKELVKRISEMNLETDEAMLWAIYEAEVADSDEDDEEAVAGQKRKTILAALAERGVED